MGEALALLSVIAEIQSKCKRYVEVKMGMERVVKIERCSDEVSLKERVFSGFDADVEITKTGRGLSRNQI